MLEGLPKMAPLTYNHDMKKIHQCEFIQFMDMDSFKKPYDEKNCIHNILITLQPEI